VLAAGAGLAHTGAMLLLAHRGASADAPENTLAAFQEAVAQGADGVELDVMPCGSGEMVVCHDERLDRLAGQPWVVGETSWWKLRGVDVGSRLGFAPARIPLLEEVLDALPPHFLINIELKCERGDDGGLSVRVAELVRRRGLGERVILSSFNPLCLFRVASAAPELRRGYLIDPDKRWAPQAYLVRPLVASHSVHPYHADCTPERVEAWRRQGLRVAVWTVDDPVRARELEEMGVSYLITNRPGVLRQALRERR
jgi:glycerophosphoryl diester phosphodiesterase